MANSKSIHECIEINQRKQCAVDQCNKLRYRLFKHCLKHAVRNQRNGHPEIGILRKHRFNIEREQVRRLLTRNKDHVAVKRATQKLIEILTVLSQPKTDKPRHIETKGVQKHCTRLLYQADPIDMLVEWCARLLYMQRHEPFYLENLSQTKFKLTALGHALLRACPMHDMWGPQATTAFRIAKVIDSVLGKFILRVTYSIEQRLKQQEEEMRELEQPLNNHVDL